MTTIRRFFALAALAGLAVLLSACANTQYYKYKSGESNWHAAHVKCQVEGTKASQATPNVRPNNPFNPGERAAADIMTGFNEARSKKVAYEACLAELGWLPCSKGGTSADGCK